MASVQTTIEVDVPVRTAYDQWTQLESFPEFMEGIKHVEQLSATHVRFKGEIMGKSRTWEARIVEQVPDQRIAWKSIEGAENGGTVLFEPLGPSTTKVTLLLEYAPESWTEKTGDALGIFEARVKKDLHNFKEYIEGRGVETGAWRGEVHGGVQTK